MHSLQNFKIFLFFLVFVLGNLSPGLGAILLIIYSLFFSKITLILKNNKAIKLFILLFLFTLLFSFYPSIQRPTLFLEELIRVISWIALAIIGSRFDKNELKLFYKLVIYSLILTLPLIFFIPGRFQSYFPHSNHLAYFTLLPLTFFLLYDTKKSRWFYVFLLFIICVTTMSSGGVATFLVVIITYYLILRGINLKNIFILGGLIIVIIPILFYSGAYEMFYSKVEAVDLDKIIAKANRKSFGMEGSLVWRMTYWLAIYDSFINTSDTYNLLLGEGVKTMSAGNYIYNFMVRDPHNDFLRLFIERGAIGTFLFLMIFFKLIYKLSYRYIIFIILFVPMIFGNVLVSFPYMFCFIIFISMLANHTNFKNILRNNEDSYSNTFKERDREFTITD